MIQVTSSRSAAMQQGVKALIYGRSGAGKTYMARTCPSPLVISAEGGLLSLKDVDIPVVQIKTIKDLYDIHAWLMQAYEAKAYWTIYIDSISEIAEVVLANAKKTSKDPRQAYGQLIEESMMAFRAYRDLPMRHVVMLAKQELVQDEVTKTTMYGPSMPGSKLGPALPYLFDEVFRLGIGQTQDGKTYRFLQTNPDMQYDAKDRSGALDTIEPPDLTHIFNKILAS